MKKLIALLSILLVVSCALFAQGAKEQAPAQNGPVTIKYWQHSSAARDEMMGKIVEMFEAENPDIHVELEFIPEGDYTSKIVPALSTATAPDVFQIQGGMVSRLAEAGSIQPLDEDVISAKEIANDFVPATVDGLKYDGEYYGMPTDTQTIVLLWNKDLLREANLDWVNGPQTWDEFFEYARALTKFDSQGKMTQSGWGGKGYWPEVASFIVSHGGTINNEKGEFCIADDPKTVAAIKEYASLYKDDHVYDTQFSKNWAGFRQGLVGMMLGHPAMIGNLVTTAPNLDYGVALIPEYNHSRATCVTSWAYVMSSKAPSEAASKFIKFLGSEEVEKMWTLKTGELPARKALLNDPELAQNPKVAIAIHSLEDSFVGTLQTGGYNSAWSRGFDRILNTDEPIENILRDMQNELNEERLGV